MEVKESFEVLFKDYNSENVVNILPLAKKCLSLSSSEKEVLRALEISLSGCLRNFPPDELEDEVFLVVCPTAKKLVNNKLKNVEENPTTCSETLSVCLQINSYFQEVFQYFLQIQKTSIIEVRTLLKSSFEILLCCFSHCRDSEKIYGTYFNSYTKNLSDFFKKTCELLELMMNFLTEKSEIDVEDDRELFLLEEVMTYTSKSGIILIKLDVKVMAKVWKTFVGLIEKYSNSLVENLSIRETLSELSSCIISNLELLQCDENQDCVKVTKLSCFLLKLVIKLVEMYIGYLGNCQKCLLDLILLLCRLDICQDPESKIKTEMVKQVTIGTDPLLSLLLSSEGFVKECHLWTKDAQKLPEFAALSCLILKRLLQSDSVTRSLWFNQNENILRWIFGLSSSGFFLNSDKINLPIIIVNGKQKKFTDLYEYILVTSSAFVMTATGEEFNLVERILIENVLQPEPLKALLAIDMWCLIARFAEAELCFAQIMSLCKLFEKFNPGSQRVEKWLLASLIRRLFPLLARSHRETFLKSFQPYLYCALWENSSIYTFTAEEACLIRIGALSQIEAVLDNNFESKPLSGYQLETKLTKLWKFNSEVLTSMPQAQKYLEILSTVTAWSVDELSSEALFQVLSQIQSLLNYNQPTSTKLCFTKILNSLSTVQIPPSNVQKKIILQMAEIFRTLLTSKQVLVKEKTFDVFYSFAHVTSHGEVISFTVQNAPDLKIEITNYFKKNLTVGNGFDFNGYVERICGRGLEHVCPEKRREVFEGSAVKKVKLGDVEEMVSKWKEDGRKIAECVEALSVVQKGEVKDVCSKILSLL